MNNTFVDINLDVPVEELSEAIIVTGFRGFGMVGYLVSKHLALGLEARKIGYILTRPSPPFIIVEEDGVGMPFDVYYKEDPKTVIIVNRALPEKEIADEYVEALVKFAREINSKFMVLVGGLNKTFMYGEEEYGYRHKPNKYYQGPRLKAPEMETGLGVMGPLALLYIYTVHYKVPSIIVLPYSTVEEIDYNAALKGVRVVAGEILNVEIDTSLLEEYAEKWKVERERLMEMLGPMLSGRSEEEDESDRHKGIYM